MKECVIEHNYKNIKPRCIFYSSNSLFFPKVMCFRYLMFSCNDYSCRPLQPIEDFSSNRVDKSLQNFL